MDWNLTNTKKNGKDENGAGKKIVGPSKISYKQFLWGHVNCILPPYWSNNIE